MLFASTSLAGCSPTFDWRESRVEGAGIEAMFPCRPDHHSRRVEVAGRPVEMQMLVCTAGGATYAVGFFDVVDLHAVERSLVALRTGLLDSVRDARPRIGRAEVPGMTAQPSALRLEADGRRPDGTPLGLRAVVFSHGVRVFQAAVVGAVSQDEAVEPFLSGLRISG